MIETAEKSPGYYAAEVFDYVSGLDPTFKDRHTPESLLERLQDEQYAADLYLWMSEQSEKFYDDVLYEQFLQKVKKKEQPVATESALDDGSSERLASRDLERDSAQSLLPEYYSAEQTAQRMQRIEEVDAQQQSISEEELAAFRQSQLDVQTPPLNTVVTGEVQDSLVEDLRRAYGRYGFRFEGGVFGETGDITVYSQALGIPKSHTIRVRGGMIPPSEGVLFEDFLASNKSPSMSMDEDTRTFAEKSMRVRELRPVGRNNGDGTTSTVKMASAEVDGKFIAYPTLFPKEPDAFHTQPSMWLELGGDFAIEEAYRRGEVFEFDTAEEAEAFANGSWKDAQTIDLEGEAFYAARGYDYYAEQAAGREIAEANAEYSFLEQLVEGERYEGEIPPEYQKYFIDGNMVRDDIAAKRDEAEQRANALYEQFSSDEAIRLREDWDVVLGKRQAVLSADAAEMNKAAIERQDQLEAVTMSRYGTSIDGLSNYEPKTAQEYRDINAIIGSYNVDVTDRVVAAKKYENAQLYYDRKFNKQVIDDYVEGLDEFSLKIREGLRTGNTMVELLKINFGITDDEDALARVNNLQANRDTRLGRTSARVEGTVTTSQLFDESGRDLGQHMANLAAESLSMLFPLGARIVPTFGALGAGIGFAAGGPVGGVATGAAALVGATGAIGGAIGTGFAAAALGGMSVSAFMMEWGNSILEVGNEKGYDWADPQSAMLAYMDDSVWQEGTERGIKRGIPIAAASWLSGAVAGRLFVGSKFMPKGSQLLAFGAERAIVDPAFEAAGEFAALVASGQYTGSVQDMKEISAEALGSVGASTPTGAVSLGSRMVNNSRMELGLRLMDPKFMAEQEVSNRRLQKWVDNAEKLGKITPEMAQDIRLNIGNRRTANELLGLPLDAKPSKNTNAVARIMKLLEAKQELEKANKEGTFTEKIKEITEEIALIAETGKVESTAQVNLSEIEARTQRRRAPVYFAGKNRVDRATFLNNIDTLTTRQLKKSRVYNDPEVALLLKIKQDAVQESKTTQVPTRDTAGVSPKVGEEVREVTEEDFQAKEEGSIDPARESNIIKAIAEKLEAGVELSEVEESFLAESQDEVNEEREAIRATAAEIDVAGEPTTLAERVKISELRKLVSNAKKSLAKSFPDANIIIHAKKDSYQAAARENGLSGEGSAGFLGTDDKTIHIFAPLASETTVAHETFHVVLRNSINKAQAQELMGEFVTTLKKFIPPDNPLAAKLDRFQQLYDEGQMNEEYVAEFFGELAAAYPTMNRKGKTVVARFLERLGKLLNIDLKLPSNFTERDKQIIELLERLAGKVSKGEAITSRETEAIRSLTTDRQQTEDNLGAAEQRVDDFSDEQIQAMADEGVIFHFSDVDITKVLPEKLKRFALGYGFYFTNYALEDSVYRSFGDRFTMVNAEDFNLLDGDQKITEEQAKAIRDAAKMELEEVAEYDDYLLRFEIEQVLISLSDTKAGESWVDTFTNSRSDDRSIVAALVDEQLEVPTRIVQEMLGFDGVVYGADMVGKKAGAITVVWNFPKIDRAIIEPGQEPRAAEQRASRMDDGPPRFNEDGLPEVRAAEQRKLWEDATPERIQEYFEDEQYSLERSVMLGLANTPDVRLWFMRGGFLYGYDTPDGPVAVARIGIGNIGGKAYLDLLEVLIDEEGKGRSRGAGTRFMQEFTAVLDELNLGAELLAYPPRWYQDTMRGNEMDAIAERLVDFYSKFGFVRKREGDTSMTREPGAQPVVFDKESREDARFRNRTLGLIEKKKADIELAEKLIYNSFERLEDVLSPSQISELEEVLDREPYDLQFGDLTEEQVDRVQAEFSEVPVSDELLIENFDDLLEFAGIVKEEMDELESMQMLDPSPTKTAQETASQRERKLGELMGKEMALEHILAVNEAEYGRTETDVYNEYEQYLEGRLDEDDKKYLRSLRLGIDVNTGRVDNANDLYDVFSEFQDVRDQRNDIESGFGAAEQRVLTNEDGSPKTFYHGTDATFEEFTPTEGVRTILAAQIPVTTSAFFFTEDEAVAREYGKNVIPVNLSFSKLVNENIPEAVQIIKEVFPDGIEYSNGVIDYDDYTFEKNWIGKVLDSEEGIDWMLLDVPEFMDALKAAGFDGTLVYEGDEETSMAAFDNSNIQRLDREPRAAEQRVDVDEVRMRSRAGSRISKGLATYNVKGEKQVEEIENLTRDYVREEAPAAYIKNANILAKYPLVRGVREFGDITTVEEADELYDIYTQQTLDNLRWMMETYPDEFSEISTLWYDGANKIANEMATRFGVTPEQAAGILAALSPQKDWYQNVRLAELLLEAFEDNPVMTREMIVYQKKKTAEVIKEKKKDLKKARTAKGTSKARAKVEKFNKDKARLLNDIEVANALLDAITALEGTRMMDADPSMMGYFVRLHSEETKPPQYQVISPDGEMVGPAKKDDGSTAKWAWGSYNEIGKGVSVMLNGSQENITASLGQQHKVRNFYNNIIDPMSTEGDVTMDTHAIAVSLLKPLSTKSDEVNHNFGGKGASSSGAKGIKGTYYANQEAYQMLAEEMGLLPRQVQSVTWEAVRGLFTDKFKGNKENVKAINQIWENYADGKITIDEARAQVLERAGGVNPPVWAESVQRESGEGVREGRERGAGREGGRAAEQRVVYRAGDLANKVEPRSEALSGRSTGHFGTGFYFFGDKGAAESTAESMNRPVTELDITEYNLAPASYFLHAALQDVNRRAMEDNRERRPHTITPQEIQYAQIAVEQGPSFRDFYSMDDALRIYKDQLLSRGEAQRIAAEATRLYNEPGNVDSPSTSVMKALGYEGVNAVGTELDNYTYGTVIYDVRTEAAEQRVVDPGVVDVLERYEFKPNKSLKNAELAPELNRNLQRFGYGVKQYGTRMNDFRVVSLDTGRAVDPDEIIAAGVEERAARLEEDRRMVEMERQRELEERIIEIYNADERPFTGKDFEARAPEQRVAAAAMAEPGTIADLVARGRELGLRDASIRSVLLKRFGKDNADAIDTALTEYFDMFRAIPEAFGNVEGGIEVGRQIYDDVRRQLDEFARPKKPGRMTTRERTDRIEELRAKFPEQKNLSDTELLRKHPRQAVAPTIAEVRAEALNLLRNNRSFNEQTTEVQEQLLVAFDKTLQTSANKRVNTLMAQIRNNIRQRRKGESSAKAVRNELRKVINEMLPAGKYTKAEAKAIATLVSNVTEKNMLVQIQKVTDLLEKKAKADIKAELRDIKKLDSRIRSERKYAEREARKVQNSLRKLINEVIPRTDYGKADIAKLTNLVASVNENNYEAKAEEVLKIVEKKRGQIRDSVIRDIAKLVANSAKTSRTPSGKVRPRSLDAPGQAYFREANRILRAILNKDQSLIMDIASNLANNPMVDVATQKMLNGEKLTMREQQLVDQKSALDMFSGIQDKSLEEVEAILEDLKVDVGFSRANLKATRAARAARMAELREGAKAEVQDNWAGFATNEDGSAKTRNQLEADKTQKKTIGDALRENGLRAKYDALVEWAKEGKRLTPAGMAKAGSHITHVGALTGIMGEYFRENLYKRLGKMEERHLKGVFETKDKLDEMASTIDGVENYKDITDLIFTSNPDGLTVNTKATGRRKLSTDEMMRIYALSKNPVQRAKLEAMGFTDEVMNEIVDTVDDRLLEFVDKTVDYLANDYYEGINDVYSKVNDINLGYIENYFPTRTQVKGDLSVKSKEETLSSTFFGPNAQVADALKERTDQKGEILMNQDLGFHGELGNHFNTMERFKAYAEGVQEMNAILSSDYTVALSGRLKADSMLNMLIAHGVTPDMFMSEMSFKSIDSIISKYTGASLAFKLMQIPKQATSFIGGFQQYRFGDKPNPVKDLIMFSFDYAVLLPQILLEGITLGKYKGPIASIAKDSATFRARLESNFSGDVYGLTAGVSGRPRKVSAKDYTLYRRAATALRKGSGTATAFGDILGVLGYLPAYNRNRMRGMSQEEAVDKFNEYNETQQSRRPGERAPIQIYRNGLTRLLTAFTSSQILYLNNSLRHANNISKAIRKGEKIKAEDSRGLIFNAVMSSVLFTLASNAFLLLYGSDEEKERAYLDTLLSPIKNLMSIPVFGAAIEELYNLYVGNDYPTEVALDPLGKVVRDVKKVATGGEVAPAVKTAAELALGTNFDPGLSLINIAAGEPIEPELYNLIGVPKSARPESD